MMAVSPFLAARHSGMHPLGHARSTFAPAFRRATTTSECPLKAAPRSADTFGTEDPSAASPPARGRWLRVALRGGYAQRSTPIIAGLVHAGARFHRVRGRGGPSRRRGQRRAPIRPRQVHVRASVQRATTTRSAAEGGALHRRAIPVSGHARAGARHQQGGDGCGEVLRAAEASGVPSALAWSTLAPATSAARWWRRGPSRRRGQRRAPIGLGRPTVAPAVQEGHHDLGVPAEGGALQRRPPFRSQLARAGAASSRGAMAAVGPLSLQCTSECLHYCWPGPWLAPASRSDPMAEAWPFSGGEVKPRAPSRPGRSTLAPAFRRATRPRAPVEGGTLGSAAPPPSQARPCGARLQ